MTDKMEKIITKIRNLLDLANNNPSENEAKAAMLKAQELMLKYNVSLSEDDLNRDTAEVVTKIYTFSGKRLLQHHLTIGAIIAKNFRTKTYYSKQKIYFMGFPEDAETSVLLMDFMGNFIENAFKVFLKRDKKENPLKYAGCGPEFSKYIKRSWIQGFIAGLREAFDERQRDKTYEIMVVTPTAVMEKYNELSLRSSNLRGRFEAADDSSYSSGFESGKNCMNSREITQK